MKLLPSIEIGPAEDDIGVRVPLSLKGCRVNADI
jgi:hypothetical protein